MEVTSTLWSLSILLKIYLGKIFKIQNEAFNHFEILSKKIEVQKGCPIISIRTDHGREFDNEVQLGAFCDANCITRNFSAPRTPQSNRVVERKNYTLQEMSRTILNEQSIPQKFWCNVVNTSTYILNRILIRHFLGKTRYELFKGKKPFLEYFKVFGRKCFILNTKDYLTKFDLKSTEGIFLGYSPNSKAYVILNKETMRVEESLNVRFDESPPPKSSPLVDDHIIESQIVENQIEHIEIKENEPLNKEIVNIKEMLKKSGLEDSKLIKTPMSSETKLIRDEDGESVDDTKYYGMIGSLLYLTASRPNIMFSICLCACFQEVPKISYLEAGKRIFKYIKGTTHLGLWYPKGTRVETIVYAYFYHARDYVDRKSTSGVCKFMRCCLTSWFSKKQTALAISTIKAEYVFAGKDCQQALWMKQALVDYDIVLDDIPVLCDNKGAIDLSKNPVLHSRTKYIEIHHHFLRDNV
ncbi:retrovirus-related pol polyprotein from transposon TNT 1-94 [Tanacetum coccineum]